LSQVFDEDRQLVFDVNQVLEIKLEVLTLQSSNIKDLSSVALLPIIVLAGILLIPRGISPIKAMVHSLLIDAGKLH
jgi:hypothetical protein